MRVDFTMKTPFSGFPTKAMFLPSHESDIVCQESGEQTMAGSDEGKNAGKTVGLSCDLKGNPNLVNFHPAIFCLNTLPKFTRKLGRRTRKNVMYSHLRTSLRGNSGIRGRQSLPCFLHRWREVFASGENQRRRATSQSENRQTVFSF